MHIINTKHKAAAHHHRRTQSIHCHLTICSPVLILGPLWILHSLVSSTLYYLSLAIEAVQLQQGLLNHSLQVNKSSIYYEPVVTREVNCLE